MFIFLFSVILEVGTDIMYTLSFVYSFQQAMLTNTVKDGFIEVRGQGEFSLILLQAVLLEKHDYCHASQSEKTAREWGVEGGVIFKGGYIFFFQFLSCAV